MHTFLSDGLQIAYRVDGPEDAPPLVLINSLGTNLHMWDAQIERLSHDLRVIRFDNRGHGLSAVPTEPYTLEQLGGDVCTLLDTLGITRAHLCGISLGGMVAQSCAIHHPERVLSVTCANTAARIGSSESWNARIEAIHNGGMAAIRETVLARFFSADYRSSHPEQIQRFSEMFMAIEPSGYIAACTALRNADLRAQVSNIRVPALILAGELDESTPPAQAQELHAAIVGSKLVIFPATAHLSNVERPDEFSACVQDFVNPA